MTFERRANRHLSIVPEPEYDIPERMKTAVTEIILPVVPPMPLPEGIPPEQLTEVTPRQILVLCRCVGALMRYRFGDTTSSELTIKTRHSTAADRYLYDSQLQIAAEYRQLAHGVAVNLRPSFLVERGGRNREESNLAFFAPYGASPRSPEQPTASRTNAHLQANPKRFELEQQPLSLLTDPQMITTHQARTAFDVLRGSLGFDGFWPEIPPVPTNELPSALESMGLRRITESFASYQEGRNGPAQLGLSGPLGSDLRF